MHLPSYIDEVRPEPGLSRPQVSVGGGRPSLSSGRRRRAYEWTSLEQTRPEVLEIVINNWNTLAKVKAFPTVSLELEHPGLRPTEFDRSMMANLRKGLITEEWLVDLYAQQQLLRDHVEELRQKHQGRTIVAMADEFFVSQSLEEAIELGRSKHPGRPFYALSFEESPESF